MAFTKEQLFQWAPTLGGECYPYPYLRTAINRSCCFNGHPPLGVNATILAVAGPFVQSEVSMGTHPWG